MVTSKEIDTLFHTLVQETQAPQRMEEQLLNLKRTLYVIIADMDAASSTEKQLEMRGMTVLK